MVARAQTSRLSVVDFGAKGDAVQISANTVQNSALVKLNTTNVLTAADVGKAIELFGAGPNTTGTNYQDLIAWIVAVTNANTVIISSPAGCTARVVACTYGTQNAAAFQNCINACTGPNTDVLIPAGRYLLLPPRIFNSAYVMNSYADGAITINIKTGGIRLLGDSPATTVLLGNGAWQLQGAYAHRGFLFGLQGPVAATNSLVFQNLTMDGGVRQGRQTSGLWPASQTDGSGWDVTHGAVLDYGVAPLHRYKAFINCHIVHWRGEMVKSVTSWDTGMIQMTDCQFLDGAGSGYNFNWTPHIISGCLFSNLDMAMEYYVGTMQSPSVFQNCTVTNVRNAIVLVGGLTTHPSPGYAISSNVLSAANIAVLVGPARNLTISGNQFVNANAGVASDGSAYQGNDVNRDIVVQNNAFNQVYTPIRIGGSGGTAIYNMTVRSNTASALSRFASGYGWSTGVVFLNNKSLAPANANLQSVQLGGQWFIDDVSNQFPPQNDFDTPGQTNTVSYSLGMRHTVFAATTNVTFHLDDSFPTQIPPGAQLDITNISPYVVLLNPSAQAGNESTVPLQPAAFAQYFWTNGAWLPPGALDRPAPPRSLRIDAPIQN